MSPRKMRTAALVGLSVCLSSAAGAPQAQAAEPVIRHVFVIAMENHDESQIIGNPGNAPYINGTLLPIAARANKFLDELPLSVPSEPHYVWMEAGTNVFSDHTFTTDKDPSASNSTASSAHLVAQIKAANNGVTWMSYQEDQTAKTGKCPVKSSKLYAAKHNPFVFFQDVAGNPPSPTNAYCAAHSKPLTALKTDLAANDVASYVFITPNLCHDMHGSAGCLSNKIKAGDQWLRENLPPLMSWASQHSGVIFLAWDEGEDTNKMPFLAIGPGVKPSYASDVPFNHGSIVKSVEEIFKLPVLPTVATDNDLADLFQAGAFP